MNSLGFTFYPQNWWDSDTFLDFPPELRYIYLEIIFKLYVEGGAWKVTQTRILKKFGVDVGEAGFKLLHDLFDVDDNGLWSHDSVKNRMKKAEAARENGKKGGRPKKTQEPSKKPNKNPSLESERESKEENKSKSKIESKCKSFSDVGLESLWIDWLEFRKALDNFTYATEKSEQAAKTQLFNLADGKPVMAMQIINQSLVKGWKGFFELKDEFKKKKKKKKQKQNDFPDISKSVPAPPHLRKVDPGDTRTESQKRAAIDAQAKQLAG